MEYLLLHKSLVYTVSSEGPPCYVTSYDKPGYHGRILDFVLEGGEKINMKYDFKKPSY